MNTICRTCGTTLQSGISRDFGQCGACRQSEEYRQLSVSDERAKEAPAESPRHAHKSERD